MRSIRHSERRSIAVAKFIEPMKARPVTALPEGAGWLYEVKFDGYRAIGIKNGDRVELRSRNNKDLTGAYPSVVAALRRMNAVSAVVDGEVVAVNADGRPSFQALQHRSAGSDHQIVYYAFDLLHLNGIDLTRQPLEDRRAGLAPLLMNSGIMCSTELKGSAKNVVAAVAKLGLEGVIAKRRGSRYVPGDRSDYWLKLRLDQQQEFVVGGLSANGRSVDALLMGYYEGRTLRFAGKVRAGMTPRVRAALFNALERHAVERCPFPELPNAKKSSSWNTGVTAEEMSLMIWVRPRVVVQVRFLEWTAEDQLRHAAFVGIREDKPAREVVRESATRGHQKTSR